MKTMLRHTLALLACASLFLTACSSTEEEKASATPALPVETLYNQGMDLLAAREFKTAAAKFEEVEREYPTSEWARRAKLMGAYAFYQRSEYFDAQLALEQYTKLYPAAKEAAYAYYLIALCNYEQITDARRDQATTAEARKALTEVIRRFPDSPYARDASIKLDLIQDHLAAKEMEVGRFYLTRKQYAPAINRFQSVVDNYQTTSHVPEALHRMVEAYLALGLQDDARRTASVLGYNFPGNAWYADSYRLITGETVVIPAEKTSWWGSVKDSVKKIF